MSIDTNPTRKRLLDSLSPPAEGQSAAGTLAGEF